MEKPPVTISRKMAVELGIDLRGWTPDPVSDHYTPKMPMADACVSSMWSSTEKP